MKADTRTILHAAAQARKAMDFVGTEPAAADAVA
jgi:hypothetical protein